jgi:hypothetical protein
LLLQTLARGGHRAGGVAADLTVQQTFNG